MTTKTHLSTTVYAVEGDPRLDQAVKCDYSVGIAKENFVKGIYTPLEIVKMYTDWSIGRPIEF